MSEKKFRELKIDEELRDLLPPLTEDEYKFLEESIKEHGCTSPIHIWNDYVVDGHNRYGICKKYNYGFEVVILDSNYTKDDIIEWMIDTQLGRRNLTNIQRIEIAEKYRKSVKKKAEENKKLAMERARMENPNNKEEQFPTILPTTVKAIDTRKELAKIAGVSEGTYNKGKKILESDNEVIKQKVKSGEIKINTAYNELFPKNKNKEEKEVDNIEDNMKMEDIKEINKIKTKICPRCGQEKESDDFYIGHEKCKECEQTEIEQSNNEKKLQDEDFKKLLDRKYTLTDNSECSIDGDLKLIEEDCNDFVENLEDRLFGIEKIYSKMNNRDVDIFKGTIENFINKINNVLNKINNEEKEVM